MSIQFVVQHRGHDGRWRTYSTPLGLVALVHALAGTDPAVTRVRRLPKGLV